MEPPQPPPPSPFDPNARPKAAGRFPRPLIIGCVAILLIGGLALLSGIIYIARNPTQALQWSVNKLEEGVLEVLPPDVTQEERDRLRLAFGGLSQALTEGRVTPEQLQPIQSKVLEIVSKQKQVTHKDIEELTALLEKTAAQGRGAGGGPAAAPPSSPSSPSPPSPP